MAQKDGLKIEKIPKMVQKDSTTYPCPYEIAKRC